MIDPANLAADLAVFCDIGTSPPTIFTQGDKWSARITRQGDEIELVFNPNGKVVENRSDQSVTHANFRALLASPTLADLNRWATSQTTLLQEFVASNSIRVVGQSSIDSSTGSVDFFDDVLQNSIGGSRVAIHVLDGPAGIGKTRFIQSVSYLRALNYRAKQKPLILHVESRGRVLQNIMDLIAFSLQTLRLNVMYDQVPILVKHGLVTLAIDGFDELGDPNGYELAWAQVNDLISSARGAGTIILSGRDTFLGHDRMRGALTSIDPNLDKLMTFSLRPLSVNAAKEWLSTNGWTEAHLTADQMQPLFQKGSYALRAFFLNELAHDSVADRIIEGEISDLLSFLINAMIDREISKFGRDVENVTTESQRKSFIQKLMEEIARDIAENQTSSISASTIQWLAEVVADENLPHSVIGILKNRASVMAFLKDDQRRGYKGFIHEKVNDYFLSSVAFEEISNGEAPKFIRRNIFGRDFLETFSNLVRTKNEVQISKFFNGVALNLSHLGFQDRGRGNIGALALSAASYMSADAGLSLNDLVIDEAFVAETIGTTALDNVTIGQLDARSADIRLIETNGGCNFYSIIADEATIPSITMKAPERIELDDETIREPSAIFDWMKKRFFAARPMAGPEINEALQNFALFDLLARLIRYKPFWLVDCDERAARRILDDPNWDTLKMLMIKHDLLIERDDVPASGRPTAFYHVKNKLSLSDLSSPPDSVEPFLLELLRVSIKQKFIFDD